MTDLLNAVQTIFGPLGIFKFMRLGHMVVSLDLCAE